MDKSELKKPSVEEWLHYGDAIIRRLTECVHTYKKPPYLDVFISDAERQKKTEAIIKILRRVYTSVDDLDVPVNLATSLEAHEDSVIEKLAALFDEARKNLSWLSADMQKLMKSPWMHSFPSPAAAILFKGEEDESEGIGSGHAEHGRLPATLHDMVVREKSGGTRHQRQETPRRDEPRTARLALLCVALLDTVEPKRNTPDVINRWAEQNSIYLRTAGRVE